MIPWYFLLILFPLCCGFIGWLTNRLAVKMIFSPLEPTKLLGLRFQGVLPKHHEHFSRQMAEVVTGDFMTTSEMVERLDLDEILEAVKPELDGVLDEVLEDLRARIPEDRKALLSDAATDAARQKVYEEIRAALPGAVDRVHKQADEVVDLNELITDKIISLGPAKFAEQIADLGQRELRYIVYYGGGLGGLIGLVQFAVFAFFPLREELVAMGVSLFAVGALVGAVTNYLAIKMLFWPRRPRRLLFTTIQGLFPKRQEEIATQLARIAAEHFITPDRIFSQLAEHHLQELTHRSAQEKVEHMLDARFPALKGLLKAVLPPQEQDAFRQRLVGIYNRTVQTLVDRVVVVAVQQLDMNAILRQKVVALSKLRYEGFVRELFKEEELYLVIYGGLLGGLMGAMQLVLLLVKHWI